MPYHQAARSSWSNSNGEQGMKSIDLVLAGMILIIFSRLNDKTATYLLIGFAVFKLVALIGEKA
jgi:hypothetical protein